MSYPYQDYIEILADGDAKRVLQKDAEYGGSWKKYGGVSAFMNTARKWDRLLNQVEKHGHDIFKAIEADQREEGILDDIRDLRGYLLLIEAEMTARKAANIPF